MQDEQTDNNSKVASYWDEHTNESFIGKTYWLANPTIYRRYQSKASGNRGDDSWITFSVKHFLGERCPVERVLSIGSGDGSLDRDQAVKEGFQDVIQYKICNVEENDFPCLSYDAIYFNSSLHHMSDLDGILDKCSTALKSDGYLFINEYIGPNRFGFSERENLL